MEMRRGCVNGNAAWLCKWKCGVAVTFKKIEVWTVIGYNPEFDTCEIKKWLQTQ